uniref:Cohesin subunit SA-3-like n=1 Tax=Diabrotica virgifera virgifera TaxID=50390 RepID=A0A6P7F6H1_DIAVI
MEAGGNSAVGSSSQDSRKTSTPQRYTSPRRVVRSPSVSTISSPALSTRSKQDENVEEIFKSLSISEEKRSTSTSDQGDISIAEYTEENYDQYFSKIRRKPTNVNQCKMYKSSAKDTLYAKIFDEPSDTKAITLQFFGFYRQEPDAAMKQLIKFCIDVAGFHKFDPEPHFSINEYDQSSKRIIAMLVSDENLFKYPTLREGKYLLRERSTNFIQYIKMGIYSFIQKLMQEAYFNNILFDEIFSQCLIGFLRCMAKSRCRSIKHAGVTIVSKMLTAVVLVFNDVSQNSSSENHNHSTEEEKSRILVRLIEGLYMIFYKYCRKGDDMMKNMGVECIHETKIWIKYFPKLFICDFELFEVIIKLMIEHAKEIRMAALEACEELLQIASVRESIKPNKDALLTAIAGRFYDVDIPLSVKAVEIFTVILKFDVEFINNEICTKIVDIIFNKYAPLGKAACRFFSVWLDLSQKSPDEIIVYIARIFTTTNHECKKELLVDGFLDSCPHMDNWELFCKLIMSRVEDNEIKEALAQLFSEAVKQRLSGTSGIPRLMSKTVTPVTHTLHNGLAKILPCLDAILVAQTNLNVLNNILEIILKLNISLLDGDYCKEFGDLSISARNLFNSQDDSKLLDLSAQVLYRFTQPDVYAAIGTDYAKIVCKENVDTFLQLLNTQGDHLQLMANKVAILYQYFDLSEELKFLDPTDMSKTMMVPILKCCSWHLLWNLRKLKDEATLSRRPEDWTTKINILGVGIQEFLTVCISMLQKVHGYRNVEEFIQIFHIFCQTSITFIQECEVAEKINVSFKELKMNVEDHAVLQFLQNLVDTKIICNHAMPLNERRRLLEAYVNAIHLGVLPIQTLHKLYKYFYLFNEDYGKLIEASLQVIHGMDPLSPPYVVHHTLKEVYEGILNRYNGVVDIRSEEGKELMQLASQFSISKILQQPSLLFRILLLLWDYAFTDEQKLVFLHIAKHFYNVIDNIDTKKKLQTVFKRKIKPEFEKNDSVLFFVSFIKLSLKESNKVPAKMRRSSTIENVSPNQSKTQELSRETDTTTGNASPRKKSRRV